MTNEIDNFRTLYFLSTQRKHFVICHQKFSQALDSRFRILCFQLKIFSAKRAFCNLPLGFLTIVHGHCALQTMQGE